MQQVSLTLKSLILSPRLLGCCHSYFMLPLLLDVATHPQYCNSAFNASTPLILLLLLLQHHCSSFNIATPPLVLPLHLDVASPPSILKLHQCCRSFDGLMFLLLPNIIAPPLLLLLFLECCNARCKNELFSIADPSNWSLHKGLAIP